MMKNVIFIISQETLNSQRLKEKVWNIFQMQSFSENMEL